MIRRKSIDPEKQIEHLEKLQEAAGNHKNRLKADLDRLKMQMVRRELSLEDYARIAGPLLDQVANIELREVDRAQRLVTLYRQTGRIQ
jgi:hypothetical protein